MSFPLSTPQHPTQSAQHTPIPDPNKTPPPKESKASKREAEISSSQAEKKRKITKISPQPRGPAGSDCLTGVEAERGGERGKTMEVEEKREKRSPR
eukprot:1210819-Amorphochlora_amoeboformis.AAC.2